MKRYNVRPDPDFRAIKKRGEFMKFIFSKFLFFQLLTFSVLSQAISNEKMENHISVNGEFRTRFLMIGNQSNDKEKQMNFSQLNEDAAGRLSKVESEDTGIINYLYDENGNLAAISKSNLEFEEYSYDILNRNTYIKYKNGNGNEIVEFVYSTSPDSYLLGELAEKNEKYEKSVFVNLRGKVIEENKIIRRHNFYIKYKYNLQGNLSFLEYPSGFSVNYIYDEDNNIVEINNPSKEKTLLIAKYSMNNGMNVQFGNGLHTEIEFDDAKQNMLIKTDKISKYKVHFNENRMIVSVEDILMKKTNKTFYYDENDRLITALGPWGRIVYQYDDMNNLIFKNDNGRILIAEYLKNSAKINSLYEDNKKISIVYDKLGRLIQKGEEKFIYNEKGRLAKIYKKGNLIVEMFYNYKGQRVIEKLENIEYYFIYDQKGRVLGKYNKNGIAIIEYIYKDQMPVAFLQDGKIYYYHYDPMCFPVMISDKNGKIIGHVEYKPYGEVVSSKGNKDVTLRLPGNYAIEGANLYYNYNRTYDFTMGRYLEPDMEFNYENKYQYAKCNPVVFSDYNGKHTYFTDFYMYARSAFSRNILKIFKLNVAVVFFVLDGVTECFDLNNTKIRRKGNVTGFVVGTGIDINGGAGSGNFCKLDFDSFSIKEAVGGNYTPTKYPDFNEMNGIAIIDCVGVRFANPFVSYGYIIFGNTINENFSLCLTSQLRKSIVAGSSFVGIGKSMMIWQKEVCCN
jgi:RHS repeat-associated protein